VVVLNGGIAHAEPTFWLLGRGNAGEDQGDPRRLSEEKLIAAMMGL